MSDASDERARRLAAALRDNLHRRKAQARAIGAGTQAEPVPPGSHEDGDPAAGTGSADPAIRRAPDVP